MPICENCKRNVTPEDYNEDTHLCTECAEYLDDIDDEWVLVTREMALDAGDPSLEGQWVRW